MQMAVVGAGVIGTLRAQSVSANPATGLAAVCDADQALAARAAGNSGAKVLTDWRAALEDPRTEAVIVSTPVQLHEAMCVAALEAGKHVLCEKPLSNSAESCKRITAAAVRAGRTLAVGFNHRFYPAMQVVKRAVSEGRIGALNHVRVFGGHDGLANFRADWMYKAPQSGGGAMMDVGLHMTDLARFVAGEVSQVYAATDNRVWGVAGSEDDAIAVFLTASGIPIHYHATWNEWRGYRVAVEAYGDRGMVLGAYAPMYNLLVTQDKPGAPRTRSRQFYPDIIVREKLRGWQSTTRRTFDAELDGFLAMVKGLATDLATGLDGVRAVEIAEAAYRSSASRAAVTV